MRRLLFLAGLVVAWPAQAFVTIDWATIGHPGNAADTATNCVAAGCGAVAYGYWISKYEVTNAQYAEFLNAKAAADPLELYDAAMATSTYGGILRSGSPGSYTYAAKPGFAARPVTLVSFYDALRFANWLNNGQGSADTESGSYTLLGGTPTPANELTLTRNPGALVVLPSESEWYKAAYYDGLGAGFFEYPAASDVPTTCAAPTVSANHANCESAVGNTTDVGAYPGSAGPYGTFDQGGNVWEWNEQLVGGTSRGIRGGVWGGLVLHLSAADPHGAVPSLGYAGLGFRVASLAAECEDGADNDGDGLADLDDPGCLLASGATESPKCQDGIDNDAQTGIDFDGGDSLDIDPRDGFVDAQFNAATPEVSAADPECVAKPWRNSEGCGLGAELALLLPPLLWLRRRRGARSRAGS